MTLQGVNGGTARISYRGAKQSKGSLEIFILYFYVCWYKEMARKCKKPYVPFWNRGRYFWPCFHENTQGKQAYRVNGAIYMPQYCICVSSILISSVPELPIDRIFQREINRLQLWSLFFRCVLHWFSYFRIFCGKTSAKYLQVFWSIFAILRCVFHWFL